MQKITLLLLTKDSSENIKKYFGWVVKSKRVDEVVCVDDNSTDNTRIVLKKLFKNKAKIYERKLDDFSTQRNFGLGKCKNNWILWLDSDEELDKENCNKLEKLELIENSMYAFKRIEYFLYNRLNYGEVGNIFKTRLFQNRNREFTGKVHENIAGDSIKTNISINHHGNTTVNVFFTKINKYSTLRSLELNTSGEKHSNLKLFLYPLLKFLQNYIFRLGFLDGVPGCIFAFGMSFHSFLVRSKLWHLQSGL